MEHQKILNLLNEANKGNTVNDTPQSNYAAAIEITYNTDFQNQIFVIITILEC